MLLALWLLPAVLSWPARVAAGCQGGPIWLWPESIFLTFQNGPDHDPVRFMLGCPDLAHPVRFWSALGLEGVAVGVVPALMLRELRAVSGPASPTRWARLWDLRRAGLIVYRPRSHRLVLGRSKRSLVAAKAGVSVVVFGPTGSGKTAGICIPQVLEWDGPVVAVSVKNDLVTKAGGARQGMGKTDIYDPTGITGVATCTWSPQQRCEDWDRAMRMGQWLVQGKRGYASPDAEWEHWEDAAIRLVSCALYAGACLRLPIAAPLAWLDDGSGQQLGRAIAAVKDRDQRAWQWYRSVQERPERERGSCYSGSQKALRPYLERAIGASARESSFDPRAFLGSGSQTLFIVAPQSEQQRVSGIFTSLIMSILTEATNLAQSRPNGRLPRPLLVMLDECANTAPVRELPQYLSTARGMAITIVAIFQDLSQCEAGYGELAGSIVSNAGATVFLSGSKDRKTLDLIRDLAGQRMRPRVTEDNRGGRQTTLEKEDLVPRELSRQLDSSRAILIYRNLPPALLDLRNCHVDRDLQRATQPLIPASGSPLDRPVSPE
jgi:type IV secretion system protein VirD4